MRNLKDIILEKLKVSKKALLDDRLTVEVPFYTFVKWYMGFLNKKPDEITENDFRITYLADNIVDSNGFKVFSNAKLAYDFYKRYKEEIVTITSEKQKGYNADDESFLNTIDFIDEVFYVFTYEDFVNYIQYCQEIEDK